MMKCFVLLVIAVSAVFAVPDGCSYDDLKYCATSGALESLVTSRQLQITIDDVTKLCEQVKKGDTCVQAFNKRCIKNPIALRFLEKIHAGFVGHYNDVCGSEQGKQDFLDRIQCYSNPNLLNQLTDIHQRYVGLVEKLVTYDKNDILPSYCCAILYFRDNAKALNAKECGKPLAEYVDSVLKGILQKPFSKECGDVSNYPQCASSKLNAAHQADFKTIIDANPPLKTKYKNALPTLYEIFFKFFN